MLRATGFRCAEPGFRADSRALGYQAHEPAANMPKLAFAAPCQVLTKKLDTAANAGSGAIEQAEKSQSQSAFTRSALAHEAHNFAGENFDTGGS